MSIETVKEYVKGVAAAIAALAVGVQTALEDDAISAAEVGIFITLVAGVVTVVLARNRVSDSQFRDAADERGAVVVQVQPPKVGQ